VKVVGDPVVPKKHKEYRKKDPQQMLVEGPIGNLTIDVPGGTNVGSHLGPLDSDKTDGGEDDFADMFLLEDASDHERSSPMQGLSSPTSDIVRVSKSGMVGDSQAAMQPKGLDLQLVVDSQDVTTPIDGHRVEVSTIVDVPSPSRHTSPLRANSFRDDKALLPDKDTYMDPIVPTNSYSVNKCVYGSSWSIVLE